MMMTKRKSTHNLSRPASYSFRLLLYIIVPAVAALAGAAAAGSAPLGNRPTKIPAGAESASGQGKPSPNDCVLYATVFTEEGWLLQDADILVHPTGKKKPQWETSSDIRGEFAVRVPPVGDYEIEVKAKGYVTQTKTVTAQLGERLDMVFHMPHQPAKK